MMPVLVKWHPQVNPISDQPCASGLNSCVKTGRNLWASSLKTARIPSKAGRCCSNMAGSAVLVKAGSPALPIPRPLVTGSGSGSSLADTRPGKASALWQQILCGTKMLTWRLSLPICLILMEGGCMVKSVSALHGHMKKGRYGSTGKPGVCIEEVSVASLIQISSWPDTVPDTEKVAAKSAGLRAAPGPGQVRIGKKSNLLRIEPLKWWVISDHVEIALPSVVAEKGMVLDLASSRTWL